MNKNNLSKIINLKNIVILCISILIILIATLYNNYLISIEWPAITRIIYNNAYYGLATSESLYLWELPKKISLSFLGKKLSTVDENEDNPQEFIGKDIYSYNAVDGEPIIIVGNEKDGFDFFIFNNFLNRVADINQYFNIYGIVSHDSISSIEVYKNSDDLILRNKEMANKIITNDKEIKMVYDTLIKLKGIDYVTYGDIIYKDFDEDCDEEYEKFHNYIRGDKSYIRINISGGYRFVLEYSPRTYYLEYSMNYYSLDDEIIKELFK